MEPTGEDGHWTIQDGKKEISFIVGDDGEVISLSMDVGLDCPRNDDSIAKSD